MICFSTDVVEVNTFIKNTLHIHNVLGLVYLCHRWNFQRTNPFRWMHHYYTPSFIKYLHTIHYELSLMRYFTPKCEILATGFNSFLWKCFISIGSLLYRPFCCVRVTNRRDGCFALRGIRTRVVGLRSCGHVLPFLWQFLCWRWSEDAHGCLTVTYGFWLRNKSHHHLHLLHYLLQSCVLWKI